MGEIIETKYNEISFLKTLLCFTYIPFIYCLFHLDQEIIS